MNSIINKTFSVIFATFSCYEKGKRLPRNGMIDSMLYFFVPRVKTFILLDQPHPISDTIHPFVEVYRRGKMSEKFRISSFSYLPVYLYCLMEKQGLTRISYKLRDFFSVFIAVLTRREKYDLFVGLEAINTIAGIVLKKLGLVKIVIYYVSDYSPIRFGKTFFNRIYLGLDRFCVTHADCTWDVSPAMQEGRIKAGLDANKKYRVIHVPNGLFPSQIRSLPISQRTRDSLVYMGNLEPDFGVELAIRAFQEIKKKRSEATLRIIGGGENLLSLNIFVKKFNLEKDVIFYGHVIDNDEMARIVRTSYIGLAPYRAFPESIRWYGDAGKIRQYTAAGLPVVTTHVPPLGRYVVERGAGIMTKDTVKSFSDGILRLLSDDALYEKLSAGAVKVSRDNTWENVYTKALEDMEKMIE